MDRNTATDFNANRALWVGLAFSGAFVLLIWFLAKRQDAIDREFGVAEDD